MAADDVVVRIRFDTREAERELDKVSRQAEGAGVAAGGGLLRRFRGAAGFLGAAGLLGGAAALTAPAAGQVTDVLVDKLSVLTRGVEKLLIGADTRGDIAGTRRAVAETAQAFGPLAGVLGELPPGARSFFEAVEARAQQEERGAQIVRDAFAGRTAVEGGVIGAIGKAQNDAMTNSFKQALDAFGPEFASVLARVINTFK